MSNRALETIASARHHLGGGKGEEKQKGVRSGDFPNLNLK